MLYCIYLVYRQKLQSPWTHPAFVSRMKDLETKFLAMKNELKGVPKSIEPIDWAYLKTQ